VAPERQILNKELRGKGHEEGRYERGRKGVQELKDSMGGSWS